MIWRTCDVHVSRPLNSIDRNPPVSVHGPLCAANPCGAVERRDATMLHRWERRQNTTSGKAWKRASSGKTEAKHGTQTSWCDPDYEKSKSGAELPYNFLNIIPEFHDPIGWQEDDDWPFPTLGETGRAPVTPSTAMEAWNESEARVEVHWGPFTVV